jgi:hypothetical protein
MIGSSLELQKCGRCEQDTRLWGAVHRLGRSILALRSTARLNPFERFRRRLTGIPGSAHKWKKSECRGNFDLMIPKIAATNRGTCGSSNELQRAFRMSCRSSKPSKSKISAELARRSARLAPDSMARAVVLLDDGQSPVATPGRASRAARKEIAGTIQTAAGFAIAEVDQLLARSGGRRLGAGPDVFGSIAVEAPATALLDLARSEHVRALLEDQPVSLMREPDR